MRGRGLDILIEEDADSTTGSLTQRSTESTRTTTTVLSDKDNNSRCLSPRQVPKQRVKPEKWAVKPVSDDRQGIQGILGSNSSIRNTKIIYDASILNHNHQGYQPHPKLLQQQPTPEIATPYEIVDSPPCTASSPIHSDSASTITAISRQTRYRDDDNNNNNSNHHFDRSSSSPPSTRSSRLPTPRQRRTQRARTPRSKGRVSTAVATLEAQQPPPYQPSPAPDHSKDEWEYAQEVFANAVRDLRQSSPRKESFPCDDTWLSQTKKTARSLIPPIRSFRTSRESAQTTSGDEMLSTSSRHQSPRIRQDADEDRDRTLRALEGFRLDEPRRESAPSARTRQSVSSTGDLFLDLARDDLDSGITPVGQSSASRRQSRIALPSSRSTHFPQNGFSSPRRNFSLDSHASPLDHHLDSSPSRRYQRRGTVSSSSSVSTFRESHYGSSPPVAHNRQYPTYEGERAASSLFLPRSRQSSIDFDAASSHRRRESLSNRSIADSTISTNSRVQAYRAANHSNVTMRKHHPSPLAQNNMAVALNNQVIEDGESIVSTNTPSTVWDELDVLKTRIHRLESTGKMPTTSSAAVANAMNHIRPHTATTTSTSLSISPGRERGLSVGATSEVGVTVLPSGDAHPLLRQALDKCKTQLPDSVFKALHASARDALNIASLMGKAGTPGPMSSTQFTNGIGATNMVDRQLRRKADSICRSLTDLCLALLEVGPIPVKDLEPPKLREDRTSSPTNATTIEISTQNEDTLSELQPSPKPLSLLEKRRAQASSTSRSTSSRQSLLMPYEPSPPPDPATSLSRRTSLLQRVKRLSGMDDELSRAPSRAVSEARQIRASQLSEPRKRTSLLPQRLQDESRHSDGYSIVASIESDNNDDARSTMSRATTKRGDDMSVISYSEGQQARRTLQSGLGHRNQTLPVDKSGRLSGISSRRSLAARSSVEAPSESEATLTSSPLSRLAEIRSRRTSNLGVSNGGVPNSGGLPRSSTGTGLGGRPSLVPRASSMGLSRSNTSRSISSQRQD